MQTRAVNSDNSNAVKYCNPNFKLHSFYARIESTECMYQVVKMLDSVYIWVGYKKDPRLEEMTVAVDNRYGSYPIATALISKTMDETPKNLAMKLCKRLKKPVYLSLNVPFDSLTIQAVERRLHQEIRDHPHKF